ncbi:hypothetical protein AB1Y20_008076 [Prymnesium parvum]|uniref:Uncharacterized protein n=1 Tax=Prymnesium parvum TaxID=97485 RepID=A0AB34ITQ2_PRYPA
MLARALLLPLLLPLAAAARSTFATVTEHVKQEVKATVRSELLGVRVGYARLRGNLIEAAGVATGGTLVFAGARYPHAAAFLELNAAATAALPSAWPVLPRAAAAAAAAAAALQLPAVPLLLPWLVVGGVSCRSCHGAVLDGPSDALRHGAAHAALAAAAALAGCAAAARTLHALPQLSLPTLAAALFGAQLLVESGVSHLRNELDQIVLFSSWLVLFGPLRHVAHACRVLRRQLLPLPRLVANRLNFVQTVVQSAVGLGEAAFERSPLPLKLAAAAAVGAATQVPAVQHGARRLVNSTIDGRLGVMLQAPLPERLRGPAVAQLTQTLAMSLPPFALAESIYQGTKSALVRSARWVLPFYLAAWGSLVQTGRLALVGDAPQVLLHLLPLKWGDLVPEPAVWLAGEVTARYNKWLIEPGKALVRKAAAKAASLITLRWNTSRVGAETKSDADGR